MICVIGEALIDLVQQEPANDDDPVGGIHYRAHPGGSPFNVAIGLARLGQHTQLQARLSDDAFGRQLRAQAATNGVDLSIAVSAAEPSTLAIVGLDENRNATYDFYLTGTADWRWTAEELRKAPESAEWVHTGSLASWTQPGSAVIEQHLQRIRTEHRAVISYDPNIRPLLMADHVAAVASIERMVALAHVVKASAEDLAWLYPQSDTPQVLRSWRALGPSVVVVTDGAKGAKAITSSGELISVGALPVTVVDTVGAGDAFMAGLINALNRSGQTHTGIGADALGDVLHEAVLVAALTCERAGANPPTEAELAAAQVRTKSNG
jgi:fructokinase